MPSLTAGKALTQFVKAFLKSSGRGVMLTLCMVGAGTAVTEPGDIPGVEAETAGRITIISGGVPNLKENIHD